MKNKSKLAKIKNNSSTKIKNWFFMSNDVISVEEVYEVWSKKYDVEFWREQEILELAILDKSIDLEPCPTDFWDDESRAYLLNNNIKTTFAVTISDTRYEESIVAFKYLCEHINGYFCADTEDFTPRI